jgi:hypothetical protein
MSSIAVREQLRAWMRAPEMVLPFHDTINQVQHPTAPMWSTLSFVSAQTQTLTYCGHIEERGIFDFIALGVAGAGDVALFNAAEHDVAQLMARRDPGRRLTLIRAGAPEDFLQGGSTPFYTVSMTVEYFFLQPLMAELP